MVSANQNLGGQSVEISAIHLVRIGDDVIVKAESGGQWIEVIREFHDGSFSHIVVDAGMQAIMDGRSEPESGVHETLWPPASRIHRVQ